ncbi:hypothetical protein [Halalkalibacter okhensis]|uniref:Uncharacterized protein n=1 Tax=Halalkalibacter okhensis TaxID=333138 RepID=A0A0B0IAV3_9BACI|nr:hypothetical protein [Halalkalibacter okhensis]KHF37987.1 hypothetical protein LQ50_24060 [Halalkalibacter okhensis]
MKEFIGVFFACLVICYVATFFFAGLILDNFWAIVTLIAFFLSVFITIFIKQETRIEELEKKVEKLLNNKQD